jgi:hypothetical protein
LKQDDWGEGWELWMASKGRESSSSVTDEPKLIKWVKQQQDDYVKWRKGEPTFLEDEGFQLLNAMGFYWGDGVYFDPAKKGKALLKPSAAPLTKSQKFNHPTLKPPVVIQSVTPKIRQTETRHEIPLQKPIVVMNSLPPTDEKEKKADDTLGFGTFRGRRCSVEGTSTLPTEEKQNSEKEAPIPIQISDTSIVKGFRSVFVSASLFKEPSRFSSSITTLKEPPSKTPPTVNESTAQIAPTPTLDDSLNNIVATLPLENRAKMVPALPSKEKGSEPKIIVVSDSPFKESAIRVGMDLTVEEPTKRVASTPPLKALPSGIPFVKEQARSIISNLPFKKRRTDFVVTQPGTNAAGSTSTLATVSLIAPTKLNSNSLSREPTGCIISTLPLNRQTSASHQFLKEYAHNVVNLPLNKPTPTNVAPSPLTEPDISFVSALPLKEPTTTCTSTPSSEEPTTLQGGNKRRGRRKVDDALAGNDEGSFLDHEDQKLSLSPFFQSNQLKANKRMTFSFDDTISNVVAGERRIPLMSPDLPGSKLLGEIPLHPRLSEQEKSDFPRKVESMAFIGPESYDSKPGFPTEIDNPETIEARPERKLSGKLPSLVEVSVNSTAILEKATPTSPALRNDTLLTKIGQIHIKLNPARSDREKKKVVQTAIQTGKPSSFSCISRDAQKKTSLKLSLPSGFPERDTVALCVPELKSDEEQSTVENRDILSQKDLNLVQAEATTTSKFDSKMSDTLHGNQPQIQNDGLERMRDSSSIFNRTSTPSFGGAHNAELLTADISKTEQGDALVPISCEAMEESNVCAYTEVMQHNASVVVAFDCIGQHDDSGCARQAQSMAPKGEREKPKNNPGGWKTPNGMAQKSTIMGKEGHLPLSLQWERVKENTRIASEYLSSDVDDEEEKIPPADGTGPPQLCDPQTMPESCKLAKPKRPFENARWKHKKGQHSLIASSSDLSDSCRSGTSKASETRISSQTVGDKSWEQFYQELTAFIAAGNNIALEVNRLLRDWALQQFDEYENHMYGRPTKLSLDQFALLQQIDFEGSSVVRDADSAEWIEYYEMLLKHFEEHGSLSGVQSWSTLGKWVETLRIHFGFYVDGTGGCLTNERVDLLQAIDFEFAQPRRRAQPDRFGVGTKQHNVATGGGPSKTPSRDNVNCKKGRSGKRKAHESDKQHVSGECRPKRWPAAAKNRIERDRAASRNHRTWWASRDDIVKRSIRRKTRTADEGHDDFFDHKADAEIVLSEMSCSDDYTSDSESSFLESAAGCASEGEPNSDKVRHAKQQVVTYHDGNATLLPAVKKWARKDKFDNIDDETYDRLLKMKEPLEAGPGVSKLDAIANKMWQVRFEELVEFRKRFKHCMVPTEDKSVSFMSGANRFFLVSLTHSRRAAPFTVVHPKQLGYQDEAVQKKWRGGFDTE